MKAKLAVVALLLGTSFLGANLGLAKRASGNLVATVSLGKHFDRTEVIAVIDPALAPLGFARMPDSPRDQTLASVPGINYQAAGGAWNRGVSAFIFPERSLDCVTISVTDFTQMAGQRVIPAINAIATALAKRYGSAMKYYSDGQCLHEIPPPS